MIAVTDLKEFQRFEQRPFVRKETCSEIEIRTRLGFIRKEVTLYYRDKKLTNEM